MPFNLRDAFLAIVALQSTFGYLYINSLAGKFISIHNPEEPGNSPPLPALKKITPIPQSFTSPVPNKACGTFYVDKTTLSTGENHPIKRGFEARGWHYVSSHEKAHVVYTRKINKNWLTTLEPYQRYNHIPGYVEWNVKDKFNKRMLAYKKSSGKQLWSVPKTFRLNSTSGREKFRKVLFEQGGLSRPWVLKVPNMNRGRGITMLGPNTEALKNVLDKVEKEKDNKYIIQEYVCNAMTIEGYKFDFRVFWLVASVDPLVVMWHPGYLRIIMNQKYDQLMKNWNSTKAHLTNIHGSGSAGSWATFAENLEASKKRYIALHHVENQVKHSLAEIVDAFRDVTFSNKGTSTENLFGFYCADYMIDRDLDVYIIEPQRNCGMSELDQFKKDLNMQLTEGMAEILKIVTKQQELGLPLNFEALENAAGSAYEVIYNDGWMFEYEGYERPAKKGCEISK
jgi:hypothetical protein